MNKLYFLIIILMLFSCERTQKHEKNDKVSDSSFIQKSKYIQDSISKEWKHQQVEDSITNYLTDSLRKFVKKISRNKNISIPRRINRIRKIFTFNNWADLYEEGIDRDKIIAQELSKLMMDSNINNYNLENIFDNSNFTITHSKDERIWAISWCEFMPGTSISPKNVIVWKDTLKNPQGYVTSYSNKFQHLIDLAYWEKIYKLDNSNGKLLYLILGSSKDWGNIAVVVEMTSNGINLKYGGFKVNGIFQNYEQYDCFKLSDNRRVIYNLGCMYNNSHSYRFDEKSQILTFSATSINCYHISDTLVNGTLTFNGEYFTEKIDKQKIKSPNP